jgi:hypothetical protein
MSKNEK